MEAKTYLKAVQEMRRHLVEAYVIAGTLRDYRNAVEKDYFNQLRYKVTTIENDIEALEKYIIIGERDDMKL